MICRVFVMKELACHDLGCDLVYHFLKRRKSERSPCTSAGFFSANLASALLDTVKKEVMVSDHTYYRV